MKIAARIRNQGRPISSAFSEFVARRLEVERAPPRRAEAERSVCRIVAQCQQDRPRRAGEFRRQRA